MASLTLGFLSGFGDLARKKNDQDRQDSVRARDEFAKSLERIMESEDWPEPARVTAAKNRMRLFSDPKIKPKDYEKLLGEVHESSRRPGAAGPEVAAARGNAPVLRSLQQRMGQSTGIVPGSDRVLTQGAARPTGSSILSLMGPGGQSQTQNPFAQIAPPSGMPSSLNLQQPVPEEDNLIAPMSDREAIGEEVSETERIAATPVADLYGPITRGERNQQAMEQFRAMIPLQLDFARQKAQVEREIDPPDTFADTAGGRFIYNKETGEFKPTGYQGEENKTQQEQAIADRLAATGLGDTPANRDAVRRQLIAEEAALRRNPAIDTFRQIAANRYAEEAKARTGRDQRDYIFQASKHVNDLYNESVKTVRVGLPFARSIREAIKDPSKGGDFMAMYSTVRAVDPNSVVREGELTLLRGLLSHLARIEEQWNKWGSNKPALAAEGRKIFERVADLVEHDGRAAVAAAQQRGEYLARQFKIPPSLVGIEQVGPDLNLVPKMYPDAGMPLPGVGGAVPPPQTGPVGQTGAPSTDGDALLAQMLAAFEIQ
jgi:hypothetical protein